MLSRPYRFAFAAAVILSSALAPAMAELVTYQLDPDQSVLELSGAVFLGFSGSVFSFADQGAGSRVAHFGGQITGDLSGGTLTFDGASSIVGLEHPLPAFNPPGPGVDVFGAMNYALNGSAANRFFDIALTLPSGAATHAAALTAPFAYRDGSMAHTPFAMAAAYSIAGSAANNGAAGAVSISQSAGLETLVLPVNVLIIRPTGPGVELQTRLTGQLVATRVIPEPGALGLLLVAAAAGLRRR